MAVAADCHPVLGDVLAVRHDAAAAVTEYRDALDAGLLAPIVHGLFHVEGDVVPDEIAANPPARVAVVDAEQGVPRLARSEGK